MQVVDGIDGVVLRAKLRCARIERCGIVPRPPVAQVPLAVGLATLIVEAMANLMTDHGANAAIVRCVVGVDVEEGRLEDSCRKHNLIIGGVVVRIHRLRRHAPSRPVNRLAKSRRHVLVLEQPRTHGVAHEVAAVNRQLRVVTRHVGISDLHREVRQLLLGRRLGGRAHPLQAVDAHRVRIAQVFHQRVHAHLRFRLEEALHVHLACGIAQHTLRAGHGALPPRRLLLLARQRASAKREARLHERGGQLVGSGVEQPGGEVLTPR